MSNNRNKIDPSIDEKGYRDLTDDNFYTSSRDVSRSAANLDNDPPFIIGGSEEEVIKAFKTGIFKDRPVKDTRLSENAKKEILEYRREQLNKKNENNEQGS